VSVPVMLLADTVSLPFYITLLNVLILLLGIFLMLLILIQRGKGGGLSGALGGSGGSSAFGTRAGDQFTKITVYVALAWILLIMFTIKLSAGYTVINPKPAATNSQLHQQHHRPSDGLALEHDRRNVV
jgi:preprotein translocase subunit SecG